MKNNYFSLQRYETVIRERFLVGEVEQALSDVALRAEMIKNSPLAYSRIFGSPTLDRLCCFFGEELAKNMPAITAVKNPSGKNAVYVCTEVYGSGGHARVIEDLARADPACSHHVIFTNLWERPDLYTERFEALGLQIHVLPKSTLSEKLRKLIEFLHGFQKARVFLLNHHQDSAAVSAVAACPQHERFFIHHADYLFCLGLFLPDVKHIDLHPMGFHRCQSDGVRENIYWPMTCHDGEVRGHNFMENGRLTTCCCGTETKFFEPYPISYLETIVKMLMLTKGRHIHIGGLHETRKSHLRKLLQAHGLSEEQFLHIPYVPSLRKALIDFDIDAYLVSFPIGGGKALVEAMSAGIPVIRHRHHFDKLLCAADMFPPESPSWGEAEELVDILLSMDSKRLQNLSMASRTHYESNFSTQLFDQCVLSGESAPLPIQISDDVEPMQRFLFEENYLKPLSIAT